MLTFDAVNTGRSSMPDPEKEMSAFAQVADIRTKQHSRSSINTSNKVDCTILSRSSLSAVPTAHDNCVCGWWRSTLCNTAREFNTQASSFSSHLNFLRNAQQHMHRLARKCTQARLYPNPASANSKSVLETHLEILVADMDFATRLHGQYSVAISMYICPVQAVIDNLNVSGKECHCPDCTSQFQPWTTDVHDIHLEATELMRKLVDTSKVFQKLENNLLKKWQKDGKNGLYRMVSVLPEQEDLRNSAVVKKYFPRQIKEIEEAENRTIRKPTVMSRLVRMNEGNGEDEKYDSGCETVSKISI